MINQLGYMNVFNEMIHMVCGNIKPFVISILPSPYAKFSIGLDFLKDIDINKDMHLIY